jgi:hypothetical protein
VPAITDARNLTDVHAICVCPVNAHREPGGAPSYDREIVIRHGHNAVLVLRLHSTEAAALALGQIDGAAAHAKACRAGGAHR